MQAQTNTEMKITLTTKWHATIFLVFAYSGTFYAVQGLNVIPAVIPSSLTECYNNSYILVKDNLLPMTVDTLINLIRKIEDKLSSTMDMRTLAPSILSRFRFDGIERNPKVEPQQYVIPYGPSGSEFFLYRTIFQQVLPNVGNSIPNDTLDYVERCTLHWMLSSSIDIWENEASCPNTNQKYSWSPRKRRDIKKAYDAEVFDPIRKQHIMNGYPSQGYHQQYQQYQQNVYAPQESNCPMENGIIYSKYGTVSPGIVLAGISAGLNPQKSPPRNLYKVQPRGNLKRKPTNNPEQFNSRVRSGYNQPGNPPNGRYPDYDGNGWGSNPAGNNWNSKANNWGSNSGSGGGWGSNSGGGGGGGGFGGVPGYHQPSEIDSKYASTLSGVLAYVALLLGPESSARSMQIGGGGNWNSTMTPKYFFLSDYYQYMLSDARIRGSLDGMILADGVRNWVDAGKGNLKLSQLLSMYYSQKGVFGSDTKACNRYTQLDKFSYLSDQAYSMAEVLKDDLPPSVNVQDEGIQFYTDSAAQLLSNYITSIGDQPCSRDVNDTKPTVDLHVVVDCSWIYTDIRNILQAIADRCDLRRFGGSMTLVNAKDGTVLVDSMQSSTDVGTKFNSTYYSTLSMGLDFPKTLSLLRHRYKEKMDYDKGNNSAGGIARIVLLIPSPTARINDNDANNARSSIQNYKENIPDIKFLYLISGAPEAYKQFAEDRDKDVIPYLNGNQQTDSINRLINRISQIPRRIINPTCGRYWSGNTYNEISLNGYLDPGEFHFYRIQPNYFFRDADAKITISSDPSSPITYCISRTNSMPIANQSRTSDITCQDVTSSNSFTIPSDVCSNAYYLSQCNPYYISITSKRFFKTNIYCNDAECRDPDMVKYTISHKGLTCYSGVSKIIFSPIILVLVFVNLFKNL